MMIYSQLPILPIEKYIINIIIIIVITIITVTVVALYSATLSSFLSVTNINSLKFKLYRTFTINILLNKKKKK